MKDKFQISNFKFLISKNLIKKNTAFIVLILVSLIPLLDLFHPGLPVTHDGQDHVARIANFYSSLQEGNIVPRWAEKLNWGYGHPILMFLYPMSSYAASFFHFLGFSLIDSLKLVFGFAFVLSGITMFLWVRNFLGDRGGFIAGILYIFAPYRFVDLYVRGAIGEHVAFVFPPLILYFLLKLSKKYSFKYIFGGCLSFAGLLLSHNAISIIFLPFIIFYALFLIMSNKNKINLVYQYFVIFVLGFGLSSFFLLPAFFEGKYTLRDIVTGGEYFSRFVNLNELLYGSWSYGISGQFTVQVGVIQLILVLFSLLIFFKKDVERKEKVLYFIIFFYFIISLFIMLKESNFIWMILTTLQKFQFPWRFLSVIVFASAVIGAFSSLILPKKIKSFLIFFLLFVTIFLNKDYWHANEYFTKDDNFFNKIYNGTTDTGESAPIWSVRFMEKEPENQIEIIDGAGVIKKIRRSSTIHEYKIISQSDNLRVKDNTLYFPGWEVYADGKKIPVQFQDSLHRGLMTFNLGKGDFNVLVKFEDTKLRQMSNMISVLSIISLIIYGIFCGLNRPKVPVLANQTGVVKTSYKLKNKRYKI